MDYVILNGVKSTTLNGFMIQSLPPISKPLMRTSVEEIDGRDGDIVTKLGYSAYDKQMSIGLFGEYDIDDVIKFFDSEGTVVFSNEPDKFYYYQIIQQIDFEKLIRFKTATVTFHVQPFKYSAVDDTFSFTTNKLTTKSFSATKNGVTCLAQDGVIYLQGIATNAIEFYVPINAMALGAGEYTLQAFPDAENDCLMRVVENVATNAESFGETYVTLSDDATLTATLTEPKTYNYVWLYVPSGAELDLSLDVKMIDDDANSFAIINRGNIVSRPTFTIYGSGTVTLSINGAQIFVINMGNAGYITIDSAQMNAYKNSTLMNRSVVGDYSELVLQIGTNIVSWTGDVTQIEVENYARWI